MLSSVAVQMRSSIKFLSAEKTLVHLDVSMEDGMAVEMVSSVKSFPTDLAEELFVFRVRMREYVALKLVFAIEALSTDLARNGNLLALPTFHAR